MTNRRRSKTPKKRRGRPRRSPPQSSTMNSSNDAAIITLSSTDSADETRVAGTKEFNPFVLLENIALTTNGLNDQQRAILAKFLMKHIHRKDYPCKPCISRRTENEDKTNVEERVKKSHENLKNNNSVVTEISLLDSTSSSEVHIVSPPPKRLNINPKIMTSDEIKDEPSNARETEVVGIDSQNLPGFGEPLPENRPWEVEMPTCSKATSVSNYAASVESNCSSIPKRCSVESQHSSLNKLNESRGKEKIRKSAKRRRKYSEKKIEKIRKELESNNSVNEKATSAMELTVNETNSMQTLTINEAQSYEQQNESINAMNDLSGKGNIVNGKDNIVSAEEIIETPLNASEKAPIANDMEQPYDDFASHVTDELQTEALQINEVFQNFLDNSAKDMLSLVTSEYIEPLFTPSDMENMAHDKDYSDLNAISLGNDPPLTFVIGNYLPGSLSSAQEDIRPEDIAQQAETSVRNHDTLEVPMTNGELAKGLENRKSRESNQEQNTIVESEILPRETTKPPLSLQQIRENRKRRKSIIIPPVVPEIPPNNDNSPTDVIDINITPEKEVDPLANERYEFTTNNASAKDDPFNDDVLNNNETIIVKNKNEVDSGQEPMTLTIHRSSTINDTEINADEERNAMENLLNNTNSDKALLEPGSPQSNETDKAIAELEHSIAMNIEKNSRNLNEAKTIEVSSVEPLTEQNLIKFTVETDRPTEKYSPTSLIRRQTIDTDASSRRTDRTEGTTESARIRKRNWVTAMTEQTESPPKSGSSIKLKRTKLSTGSQDSDEKLSVSKNVEQELEAKEPNLLSDLAQSAPTENPIKIDSEKNSHHSVSIKERRQAFIEQTGKASLPTGLSQGSVNETRVLPSFGSLNHCNMTTSTPTKNHFAPAIESDSDESSSSESSSDSSSSSSDEDSTDEAEDEELPREMKIDEKSKVVSAQQVAGSSLTDSGVRTQTNQIDAEMENNVVPFGQDTEEAEMEKAFGEKTGEVEIEKRFVEKTEEAEKEKAAGSLSMNDGYESENSVDDNSDAISLDPGSILSPCGSPDHQEPAEEFLDLPVPAEKKPKRSDVRSRLGPRVVAEPSTSASIVATTETTVHDNKRKPTKKLITFENTATNNATVEAAPNETQDPSVAPNRIRIRSIETVPETLQLYNAELFFRGRCFMWLRTGSCRRPSSCLFKHEVNGGIMFHVKNGTPHLKGILAHAMSQKYTFFIHRIQGILMSKMTEGQIISFVMQLSQHRVLHAAHVTAAAGMLRILGLTDKEMIDGFEPQIPDNDFDTAKIIIEAFHKLVQPGNCWDAMKKILMRFSRENLPIEVVIVVLNECVTIHNNTAHVEDVYKNLISNLPNETINALEQVTINRDLLKAFYDLRIGANVAVANDTVAHVPAEPNDPPIEVPTRSNWDCSIASPDSPRESIDFSLTAEVDGRPTTSSPIPALQGPSMQDTSRPSTSSGARSQKCSSTSTSSSSYSVKSIDKLPKAKSVYEKHLWKFHLHLQGVQDALKYREYDFVMKILTDMRNDPQQLPHIAGFYNILCKEIMSSRYHLDEIVRRTVQSGVSNELRRFVYDLGTFVITTLADKGYWVLAFDLLKTFRVYGEYNTCAFTLLSAEIYIANHRPLKALTILKQSRLVFTNPRMWNQMWCTHDELLRVSVIELLLTALCDRYVDYSFALLDFLLGDQCSSVKPININRHVDRIATVLLAEKKTSTIVDLGRLIIPSNLLICPKVFRALINHIFHHDRILAKELHQYSTWLGVYNMPKISGITHLVVNIDWTEEEMFLMFSSLLYELYMNIGHAIDRLRPRQLSVYLILEAMPTEQQLHMDVTEAPLSNAEIKKRRDRVKNVFERFDPKIKLIQKAQGRICKIQSESLVNYLKAGHFKS